MKRIIILILFSLRLVAQEKTNSYYFSATGDTILFPVFSIEDSTYITIAKFADGRQVEMAKLCLAGFSSYTVPDSLLKRYNLVVKGILQNNSDLFEIRETTGPNKKIGRSLDLSKDLYRVKLTVSVFYKGKAVLENYKTQQDYDALEKKDFSKESYFIPHIIRMESRDVYYVTLSPRVYHPDLGTRVWSVLYDFNERSYFGLLIK